MYCLGFTIKISYHHHCNKASQLIESTTISRQLTSLFNNKLPKSQIKKGFQFFLFFFLRFKFYLKGGVTEKGETETEICLLLYSPNGHNCQSRVNPRQEFLLGLPCWKQEPEVLGHFLHALLGHKQGAGLRVEQPALEPVLRRYASTANAMSQHQPLPRIFLLLKI